MTLLTPEEETSKVPKWFNEKTFLEGLETITERLTIRNPQGNFVPIKPDAILKSHNIYEFQFGEGSIVRGKLEPKLFIPLFTEVVRLFQNCIVPKTPVNIILNKFNISVAKVSRYIIPGDLFQNILTALSNEYSLLYFDKKLPSSIKDFFNLVIKNAAQHRQKNE